MTFVQTQGAPPRADREELIDSEEPSAEDFAASFRDVARINYFLGGTNAILSAIAPLLAEAPPERPIRILDIATGSADIPRALVQAARSGRFGANRRLEITAIDNHAKVLTFARSQTPSAAYPEIQLISGDAFALPYSDGAFDIALCSLAFHHFGPERCVALLREMERLTTRGFIVNDLIRDRFAAFLIRAVTQILRANRLTRHDAPLSVMRAYTLPEYRAMLRDADLPPTESSAVRRPMYRAVLTRRKREK